LHFREDGLRLFRERLELAGSIVNDADGGGEAEFDGALADGDGVPLVLHAGSDYGVDVQVEVGVFAQPLQLFVEDFERFLGDFVGLDVVDGDLEVVEAGVIELLDALRRKQITVGDEPGNDAVGADAANNVVKLSMEQSLAAADGNESCAERRQLVNAVVHLFERYGLRDIVVFIAVGTGEIAAAHGNDVDLNGMVF